MKTLRWPLLILFAAIASYAVSAGMWAHAIVAGGNCWSVVAMRAEQLDLLDDRVKRLEEHRYNEAHWTTRAKRGDEVWLHDRDRLNPPEKAFVVGVSDQWIEIGWRFELGAPGPLTRFGPLLVPVGSTAVVDPVAGTVRAVVGERE